MRQDGLPGGRDEPAEVAHHLRLRHIAGDIERQRLEQELYAPAAHHGVVAQDEEGRQDGQEARPLPGRARCQFFHGAEGVRSAASANHRLGKKDGQRYQQAGHYIDKDKGGTAVLPQDVGKTPDVAQSNGASGHGGNDSKAAAKVFTRFHNRIEAATSAKMPIGAT